MMKRFLAILILVIVGLGCQERSDKNESQQTSFSNGEQLEYRDGEYLWQPNRITISIHDGDHAVVKGKYLRMDQVLPEGETGWTMSIIDLPDTWKISELRFEGLAICFKNQHKEVFRIQPPKLNVLDFEILSGGEKDTTALEALWRNHALWVH